MPAAATYFYLRHVQISDSISCQNLSCIAAQYALGKQSLPKKTKLRPGGVNPASIFCQDLGGEPKVGILENDDEVSICLFKDGSSAFAWDMLHKRDLGH
jgi:putative hemolysin